MKKNIFLGFLIISFVVYTVIFTRCNDKIENVSISENEEMDGLISKSNVEPDDELTWDFPVTPESEEWKQFKTYKEMKEACLIPDEILPTLSTNNLMVVCINYPLRFKFYAYDNLKIGLKNVAEDFNGLRELLVRNDNAQCLYKRFKKDNLETLPESDLSPDQIGTLIVSYTLAELILSQESVIVNFNHEQLKEIATIAVKNISLKEQWPQAYSRTSLKSSAYLLCACLNGINAGILTPDLELFLETGSLQNDGQIGELKRLYETL